MDDDTRPRTSLRAVVAVSAVWLAYRQLAMVCLDMFRLVVSLLKSTAAMASVRDAHMAAAMAADHQHHAGNQIRLVHSVTVPWDTQE